jgi:hypothetical protein
LEAVRPRFRAALDVTGSPAIRGPIFGDWAGGARAAHHRRRSAKVRIEYRPLLQIQRELQSIPRGQPPDFSGMRRFRQYLRTIFPHDDSADQLLPLLAMNPMGKDHVTALLDTLLAMDADGVGGRAAAEAEARLADVPGDFKAGLVVADDLLGGGTNRYDYEFSLRFGPDHLRSRRSPPQRPHWLKDFWITGVLWTSEAASERAVREAMLTAVYRVAYQQRHGTARTLRGMLSQEGHVLARAGSTGPALDAEDIAYTREVLAPFLDAEDMRTCIECLFGDAAGHTLGFTPRGLSPWAGLALHDARPDPPPWPAEAA